MKKEENIKEEGLPDIAEIFRKRNPKFLIVIGVVLVICGSLLFHSKAKKKIIQPIEETYSVQANNQIDNKILPIANTTPVEADPVKKAVAEERVALVRAKQDELQQRLSAPLMLVNNNQANKSDSTPQTSPQSSDSNIQFMNRVSAEGAEIVTPTSIGNLSAVIAQGNFIHAILEPATNSDLPGFVRAIVSEPNYSEDGTQILIPWGSRLIGQYKSGMLQGQSRIFIVWTRLITPSGVSLQIGSPGVDNLGVSGIGADEIDRHFWQRFGSSSLLSIIGVGAANSGVSGDDQNNSASMYRSAVANSFGQTAEQSLQQDTKIPPTLTTYQGKPIMVFVAKDLNFQAALKQTTSRIAIF